MRRVRILLPALVLAMASCVAWTIQTGARLMMDGRVLSTDVQIVQGRAYVPLSDVAKVLDVTVVKTGGTYRLTKIEGAHPRRGLIGKLGDTLFSGTWQFQAISIRQVVGYDRQYGTEKAQITPKEAGDILVVITCRITNDTKAMQEVYFDQNSAGNTALTDDQGHGYVPQAYDSRDSGYTSDKMPSGSMHDFVIIFSVPKGASLKDLIYTIRDNELDQSTDFRVSLKS